MATDNLIEVQAGDRTGNAGNGAASAEHVDTLRALFEGNPIPMWVFDPRTLAFLAVNDAAVGSYGYSRAEFLAMTIADIRPQADVAALHAAVGADAPGTSRVWRHKKKDGSLIHVAISTHEITWDGGPARLVAAQDMTQVQHATQALQLMHAVWLVASRADSVEAALEAALVEVCAATGWAYGEAIVPAYDDASGTPRVLWHAPHPPLGDFGARAGEAGLSPSDGIHAHAWQTGEPVWVDDPGDDPACRRPDAIRDAGFRATVSIPVVAEGQSLAVLNFFLLHSNEEDHRLVDVVADAVRALGAVAHQKRAAAALAFEAIHDSLTGLPNRVFLAERLGQALRKLERGSRRLGLFFVDLDRFKLVNDRYGHTAGDHVLTAVAQRLAEAVRPYDTIARFGGDEFVVLCEDLDDVGASVLARRLLHSVAATPIAFDDRETFMSVSVGVVLTDDPGASPELMLRDADHAMYQAKQSGRNRFSFFQQESRARAEARLERANELRRALDARELTVHYQPLVDLTEGSRCAVEALVRWRHPRLGMIPPLEFIPAAEESGLIVSLGAWVLEQACADVVGWNGEHTVAVNLSARQFDDPGLLDTVAGALARSGLEPNRLCLEITESVLMEDIESSVEALLALRSLGVRIAIDDFGTGYSSLAYLSRLPVDVVKVDRSFVAGLGADAAADAIVASVVSLSHAMGLTVVAEGVETEEQLLVLRALGCDSAQGFYWRRPDEAAVVSTWHRSPEAAGRPIGPVDVREVVAACVEQVRTDQGRSVVVELPAGLPDAYGDAGAVRTIMKHLLGNAVTYSSPERPVVVNGAANRRWVRISVADYGVGMSNDESVRCFEQFWQSRDVELHAERGTGIGLSVVRSLVDAMGGHVVVRSRRGKGATFTVSLPRSQWVVARARGQADVAGLGQGSVIHEFMHQIGVPERKS